jgi:tetratricopeptide (TPR) repeat protein
MKMAPRKISGQEIQHLDGGLNPKLKFIARKKHSVDAVKQKLNEVELASLKIRRFSFILIGIGGLTALATSWLSLEKVDTKDSQLKIEQAEVVRVKTAAEYLESGRAFYEHRKPLEAIKEYQKAIDADPKNAVAYHLMGYSLFLTNQFEASKKAFETAIALSSDGPWIRYNASLVYWALKDKPKMLEQIQNLKRIEDMNKSTAMISLLKRDGQFKEIRKLPEVIAIIGE